MAEQSLHSPTNPHFFQSLLPGFNTTSVHVAFFVKHVQGSYDHIKTAKLRTDASDKTWLVKVDGLKLTDGWKDFAAAHSLWIGDIVIFRHEGDMVFHVTSFGPSCCDIQYTSASSHNNNDDSHDQTINNTVSRGTWVMSSLHFSDSGGKYYITRGWRKFCVDNRCDIGDLFVFSVVGDGKTTPLMCVCPKSKQCSEILSQHPSRKSGHIASDSRMN